MIPQPYQLDDRQRDALRRLGAWEMSVGGTPSPWVEIHGATRKFLARFGLVDREHQCLTRAGLVAAALLEELDQLRRDCQDELKRLRTGVTR